MAIHWANPNTTPNIFDQMSAKNSNNPAIWAWGWEYHPATVLDRFAKMFDPSNGGIGSIFRAKRRMLRKPPVSRNISTGVGSCSSGLQMHPKMVSDTNASTRFIAGPANETRIRPHFPCLNRYGFTGIIPHAMPMIKNAIMEGTPM